MLVNWDIDKKVPFSHRILRLAFRREIQRTFSFGVSAAPAF